MHEPENFDHPHNYGHPLKNNRTLSKLLNLEDLYYQQRVTPEVVGELASVYGVMCADP